MKLGVLLCLAAVPLGAELRYVAFRLTGLDCASCARSLPMAMRRVRGVERAAFRAEDSVADVHLRTPNKATLGQLRDAFKGLGYTPAEARVEVHGTVEREDAQWFLIPYGGAERWELKLPENPAMRKLLEESGARKVILEGDVTAPPEPGAAEVLAVRAARWSE